MPCRCASPARCTASCSTAAIPGPRRGLPAERSDDDALWSAVAAAFEIHAAAILARLDGPPQTNEPMRSAALCPGFLTVAALTGLPLVISELGASAGLNLIWDRFAYRFGAAEWGDPASPVVIAPDWHGRPRRCRRPGRRPRRLRPRAAGPAPTGGAPAPALLRLGRPDRAARPHRRRHRPRPPQASPSSRRCGEWLEARLAAPRPGAAHVVYHSIFWQYLPPEAQDRCRAALDAAGARATEDAPLAWLRLEGDGGTPGAALTLTLWPEGRDPPPRPRRLSRRLGALDGWTANPG
jgi:hypothetical protein